VRAALTGKQLELALSPGDAQLEPVVGCLAQAVRAARREASLELDGINGKAATTSPYRPALSLSFETDADHRKLSLRPSG
jgi:hypothetical protein